MIILAPGVLLFLSWAFWGRSLGWDELEFTRATLWVGQGRVPFLDFWEHHAPLQWFLLGPLARLAEGPGAATLLILRGGQLVFWALGLWSGAQLLRRTRLLGHTSALVIGILLFSPFFTLWAVEYRPDTLGTAFTVAALAAWRLRSGRRGAAMSGGLLAMAVLANLRLAPIALGMLLLMALLRPAAKRWGYNHRFPWVLAGFALPFAFWVLYLVGTGAFAATREQLLEQNAWFNHFLKAQPRSGNFGSVALTPFSSGDPAGMLLTIAGVAATLRGLKGLRKPGMATLFALIQVLQLAVVLQLGVNYPYHFQGILVIAGLQLGLLLGPGSPISWSQALPHRMRLGVFLLIGGFSCFHLAVAHTHLNLQFQDHFMRELDRTTGSRDRVLDGVGFALRREPAYRFWFLPTLARTLAREGRGPAYDSRSLLESPPAAVVFTGRIYNWIHEWPTLHPVLVRHFLPETPFLWRPALSGRLAGPGESCTWVVPQDGPYTVFASPGLADHPWFRNPFAFFHFRGEANPDILLDPRSARPVSIPLRWTLGGDPIAVPDQVFLKKGVKLTVQNGSNGSVGVFLLPRALPARFQGSPPGRSLDTDLFSLWNLP